LYFLTNGRRMVVIGQARKKVRNYLKIASKPKILEV
jgi:hypothetical protein